MTGETLETATGSHETPLCLSESWAFPPILNKSEMRDVIALLLLYFKTRGFDQTASVEIISDWMDRQQETIAGSIKDLPIGLVESEARRAFAGNETFSCELAEQCSFIRGRLVDAQACLYPEWAAKHQPDQTAGRREHGQGAEEPPDPAVREKALAIMRDGDPVQYLIFQAQRNHLGDIPAQKVMLCSIAGSNSVRGSGLQPSSTGDKGSGKTDSLKSVHHLVPKPWGMAGSLSAKSLFYLSKTGQLVPGTIFFSDDIEWGPIKPVYKRSTGSYQERTTHITVDKQLNPQVLEIPERFTWWLSSVESVDDDQVADRQHPIGTDPSLEHKQQVSTEIGARRARKELRFVVDEGIEVARDIIRQIKSHPPFKVLIPQAERSTWSIPADFRGQDRFWDIVEAFTILRFVQRETVDGWLIATSQDIQDAIELYDTQKVEHTTKLTPSEVGLLGAMMDGQEKTQAELARALEISQQSVSNRLKSIMGKTKYVTCENGPMGAKLYKIASTEELKTEFWRDLTLIDFEGGLRSPSGDLTTTLQPTYNPLTGIPTTITINNSNHIPVGLQPRSKKQRAERERWWIKNNKRSISLSKGTNQKKVVRGCNASGRPCEEVVRRLYDEVVTSESIASEGCNPPVSGGGPSPPQTCSSWRKAHPGPGLPTARSPKPVQLLLEVPGEAALWSAVAGVLHKYPRGHRGRRGVLVANVVDRCDFLTGEVEAALQGASWEKEVLEASGLAIWWAPTETKSPGATGVEATA